MALQSILHDPQISAFLERIPQHQRIITLKQLIYIGIKIVSNTFQQQQPPKSTLSPIQNKQNKTLNPINKNINPKNVHQDPKNNLPHNKKPSKSKTNRSHTKTTRNDKIQSTLLRQISKIRIQLETLTNKVYDHYFDEEEQSIQFGDQKQQNFIESHGLNQPDNIAKFSPSRTQNPNFSTNPFLKQKNQFFVTEGNQIMRRQNEQKQDFKFKVNTQLAQPWQRNKAKSNLQHLDDTQVRQALYRYDNQQSEPERRAEKNRQKKSHSLIEKHYQQKKKDQDNYFYQINMAKQTLKQLKKFKQSKNIPEASYRDYVQDKPIKIDHFKKKAKSKIKPLVQRDRLRYQTKTEQENFKKGFQQYEYSANQLEQQQEDSNEENEQVVDETYEREEQSDDEQEEPHEKSPKEYINSPEAEYEREREIANNNFGFYESKEKSSPGRRENGFSNQNSRGKFVDVRGNESSFSQFSQFSMSSSNSKREVGKISRRHQD